MKDDDRILVVDDDDATRDLLAHLAQAGGRRVAVASDGGEALLRLDDFAPHVVISDIYMPFLDGVELLQAIKTASSDTEVVLVTGAIDTGLARAAIRGGAADYIVKPIQPEELEVVIARALEKARLRIENRAHRETLEQLVEERTLQLVARNRQVEQLLGHLEDAYQTTLDALAAALDLRDNETHDHSARVAAYSVRLGEEMGLDAAALRALRQGAILHDVGKIAVPDAILHSSEQLSEEQWEHMRRHPFAGWEMLRRVSFLASALDVVLCHHERWDGAGYPRGLRGEEIPLAARIFAVADALDAITSPRPYREGRTFDAASETIAAASGTQFAPPVVEAFLRVPPIVWQEIRSRLAAPAAAELALDVTQWRA